MRSRRLVTCKSNDPLYIAKMYAVNDTCESPNSVQSHGWPLAELAAVIRALKVSLYFGTHRGTIHYSCRRLDATGVV